MRYECWFSEYTPAESLDEIDAPSAPDAAEAYAALHANGGEEEVEVSVRTPSDVRRFRVAIEVTYTARELHR